MTQSQTARPLVSVGMPVYNEAPHLARTLDALLAQDYQHFELIISDNASTDETPQICASYAARDARIRYQRNETNIGGVDNFNRVFELAAGEFFMWASGHDQHQSSHLSRCMEIMLADATIVLCYPQTVWVDDEGRQLEVVYEHIDTRGVNDRIVRLNRVLWGLNGALAIYGVMRAQALGQTRRYARVMAPDVALLLELAMLGTFAYVPEPLFGAYKPTDFGSWEVYLNKHFQRGRSHWAAQKLYWQMIANLLSRVTRHTRSLPGKSLTALFVLLCMLVKYRWLLTGPRAPAQSADSQS